MGVVVIYSQFNVVFGFPGIFGRSGYALGRSGGTRDVEEGVFVDKFRKISGTIAIISKATLLKHKST